MMKKENTFLVISILSSICILIFSIYSLQNSKPNTEVKDDIPSLDVQITDTDTQIPQIDEQIQPQKFVHSAWIAPFDFSNGYTSLKSNPTLFTTVTPVFYSVNSDGTLLDRKPNEEVVDDFLNYTSRNGIKVIPTIGSYDYNVMSNILSNKDIYTNHIQNILDEIQRYDFDGIDIDYEKIEGKYKEEYLDFLTTLSLELKQRNKILSVTVLPKTQEENSDTEYVQDYKRIGEIADEVRVMTYDFTLQSSTTPGPISPISWVEECIQYSIQEIPKEKMLLGIHLYAYLWKDQKASALTYSSVETLISSNNIKYVYEEESKEGYAKYTCTNDIQCTLYFQSKKGVIDRVELAKKYSLLGVTYWRLGNELNLLQF
jgi:spore germination protein YaaH